MAYFKFQLSISPQNKPKELLKTFTEFQGPVILGLNLQGLILNKVKEFLSEMLKSTFLIVLLMTETYAAHQKVVISDFLSSLNII